MGVVEDTEPPLKRAKLLPDEPNGNSSSVTVTSVTTNNSLGDLMARPLTSSQGDDETTIGSKGVIRKSEFVRIITRALYSLGYGKTGAMLEEESGIPMHGSVVKEFLQQVKEGKWDESVVTLHRIGLVDEKAVKSASFLLLEQKFLELLRLDNVSDALGTLRNEIVPLCVNTKRVHELASSLITPSKFVSNGKGKESVSSRSKVLEELQNLLPASVMVPEKRLECLVESSLGIQRDACVYHNTLDSDLSLFSDHQCGKHRIPSRTLQILESHTDEVWFLQFSHNGKYLASSSKDQTAIIWEINADGHFSLKHKLVGHQKPVTAILWSPDDRQVLTCGAEEVIRRWDVDSGDCIHMYEKGGGIGPISCGWYSDGQGIIAGMTDRSICMWDLDGREMECWKGQRTQKVSDIAMTDDGKWLVSVCKGSVISLFDREATVERLIEEEDMITSFSLSDDNKHLLVNLQNQEIRLWNIEGDDDPKIVMRYKGHKRSRFLIRSCFGGYQQAFIASGSEDSQVYIWHRSTGKLIIELPGHAGAVNCVSWSPTNLHMLASASDDGTIRIWGLDRINPQNQKKQLQASSSSNGVLHRCNGN